MRGEPDPTTEWQAPQVLLRAAARAPSFAPGLGEIIDEESVQAHQMLLQTAQGTAGTYD
jgi:hypothetical protein